MHLCDLIEKLEKNRELPPEEMAFLLDLLPKDPDSVRLLAEKARQTALHYFGNKIYIRGLIEFTNYCKNNCYYCGIRRDNRYAGRYRLTKEEIMDCCHGGYALGFRTFVLQGGEDPGFSDDAMTEVVASIRKDFPDCAITLSVGERERHVYESWKHAGANRFLLRHETADAAHYRVLHPSSLSLENRKRCLWDLKSLGYQTGTGFMVGSPGQTSETLAQDLVFIRELKPEMIGIGPFIPHKDTPFRDKSPGSMEQTLHLISILRLMHPNALIPSTTALSTIHPNGREYGILAGANVIMPNLSPASVRSKYTLYDNKRCTGTEAAEHLKELDTLAHSIGYAIVTDRGDYKPM